MRVVLSSLLFLTGCCPPGMAQSLETMAAEQAAKAAEKAKAAAPPVVVPPLSAAAASPTVAVAATTKGAAAAAPPSVTITLQNQNNGTAAGGISVGEVTVSVPAGAPAATPPVAVPSGNATGTPAVAASNANNATSTLVVKFESATHPSGQGPLAAKTGRSLGEARAVPATTGTAKMVMTVPDIWPGVAKREDVSLFTVFYVWYFELCKNAPLIFAVGFALFLAGSDSQQLFAIAKSKGSLLPMTAGKGSLLQPMTATAGYGAAMKDSPFVL